MRRTWYIAKNPYPPPPRDPPIWNPILYMGGGAHKSNGELVTKISENPSETRRISAGQNFRRGCKKFSSFQTGEEYPDMISSDIWKFTLRNMPLCEGARKWSYCYGRQHPVLNCVFLRISKVQGTDPKSNVTEVECVEANTIHNAVSSNLIKVRYQISWDASFRFHFTSNMHLRLWTFTFVHWLFEVSSNQCQRILKISFLMVFVTFLFHVS